MTLSACTRDQFNDLPHYRWVSLPGRNELKIGSATVAVKFKGAYSCKVCKNGREAQALFEELFYRLNHLRIT